jgi:DNA-binding transcriptional MerR regulator
MPDSEGFAHAMNLTFNDLVEQSGLTEHRIRHYIKRRLVPRSIGEGPFATFTEEHLHRLLAIKNLRAQGMSLATAGAAVAKANGDELLALAGVKVTPPPPPPVAQAAALAPATPGPPFRAPAHATGYRATIASAREIWEHIALCPGVELRVKMDADTEARRVAQEIETAWGKRA